MDIPIWVPIYGAPLFAILSFYLIRKYYVHGRSLRIYREALEAGLTEPASLHPKIDPNRCLGCGSCIAACPEKSVLGLIGGKSNLISPSQCIGHGACKTACPHKAITLVFGTERRGIDIPNVKPNFETNVDGIFIAGELGGMGLIRNAIRQGSEAINHIKEHPTIGKGQELDVVIIGSGPAGIAATLGAMKHKLRVTTLDQESYGGTVAHFPRGKVVMTAPVEIPLWGKMMFRETTKETVIALWEEIRNKFALKVRTGECVTAIKPIAGGGFEVISSQGSYRTNTVLLAIGRRGTPRKLGVEGEELPKVVYRLIDPEQYRGQHVLIVGGGDSALEAAISIAEVEDSTVTLSYRSGAFNRAKQKNRQKVEAMSESGRLNLLMKSNVKAITPDSVELDHDGERVSLPNDAIIVNAGGILPTGFLKEIGIEVETKYGTE